MISEFPYNLQCPILRSVEECQQLSLMVSEHFERLRNLNLKLNIGISVHEGADPVTRRLLSLADTAGTSEGSAIIRFFPEKGMYAADPAVEQRITQLKTVSTKISR